MTTTEANKFLLHGDKARIARKFRCKGKDVYDVAVGLRKGKFGRAKELAAEIIRVAEQNISEGLVTPENVEQ